MGLVKTPEEIEQIQSVLSRPCALSAETVSIEFRTTREIVERLLPPGLEPAAEPTGIAYLGRYGRSNAHAFSGGALYLAARHGDLEGAYCITMPVDTERATLFSREMIGEPKRLFRMSFDRDGNRVRSTAVRYDTTVMAIEFDSAQVLAGMTLQSRFFHYKFSHDVSGFGLQHDPILVAMEVEQRLSRVELGSGTLAFGHSAHDPLGEIEIVETSNASYSEGDLIGSVRRLATVSATDFLPYSYARIDDFTLLDNRNQEPWGEVPRQ